MPAVLSWSIEAALTPLVRVIPGWCGSVLAGLNRLVDLLKHRHEAELLASMDDRMLSDIGLTRSDLRDAYAEPLWHDPTEILARRAAERRSSRGQAISTRD